MGTYRKKQGQESRKQGKGIGEMCQKIVNDPGEENLQL